MPLNKRLSPKQSILFELQADFTAEPVEDGMNHEAENTLARALEQEPEEYLLPWLEEFSTDENNPAFASSVLRCLGRLPLPGTPAWRTSLIASALTKDDVEIRDAAIEAVEQWEELPLIHVLKAHQEETKWLRDYIQGVISDLDTRKHT